jgi:putative ABC transport system permease protein
MSDLRQAFRFIRAHRGFAIPIVLCLTLGIGLNSAIFSAVNSVLLQPLPYEDPDRLFRVLETNVEANGVVQEYSATYQNFLAWRKQSQTFASLEAMENTFLNLTGERGPERISGSRVTGGFFRLLGTAPKLGRVFLAEEHVPGAPAAVVLSHHFWQRYFGSDESVIGRSLVLDGKSCQVVGVLEPRFHFVQDADVWLPLAIDEANPPFPPWTRYLVVAGRLKPGAGIERAQAEMDTIANRMAQEEPAANAGWSVRVKSLRDNLVGDVRLALLLLLAAVGLVLLIACANVGNLLLARVVSQRDEMAIRLTLGASRLHLMRQTLSESILLALLGGLLGLALAAAVVRVIPLVGPADMPLLRDVRMDFRVLGFTLLISLLTGVLPGLLAAVNGFDPHFQERLKGLSTRSTDAVKGRRLLSGLVVAEVAAALVLLVCAGLAIRSFDRLNRTSPGFDPSNVFMAQISLPDWKYPEPDQMRGFWTNLLPRLQALPGVVSVGTTHFLPVNSDGLSMAIEIENRVPASPEESFKSKNFRKVSPGYFQTLKIPLVSGRFFDDRDDQHGPYVAIISRTMADHFWPNEEPLGKRLKRGRKPTNPWYTIVGVVEDVQNEEPGTTFGDTLYIPYLQDPKSLFPTVHLLVRTAGDPLSITSAVRREVMAVDRDQPIDKITTMDEWIVNSLSKRRFSALMLTLFGVLGITLAMIGIYGVLSYSTSRRNREIGIRMALGAQARDVVRLVLWQGMSLTAIGLAVGLALALGLTRLFAGMLYQVQPTDPATFLGMTIALAGIALLASYLPARRAARVDPLRSLKQE